VSVAPARKSLAALSAPQVAAPAAGNDRREKWRLQQRAYRIRRQQELEAGILGSLNFPGQEEAIDCLVSCGAISEDQALDVKSVSAELGKGLFLDMARAFAAMGGRGRS
jgi:hypothetical protein